MHITQPYTAVQSVSASASALFILASPFCALNAFREDVLYNIDLRKEHQRLSTPLSFRMKFSLTQLGICSTIGGDGPSDGEFGPGSD